jgi:5-methylcytosine-specific restriction endonuclease McrA
VNIKKREYPYVMGLYAQKDRFVPQELYKAIKERKVCKICGRKVRGKNRLQVHHKIPVSQGGKSDYQNCIGVCKECHWKIHNPEITMVALTMQKVK